MKLKINKFNIPLGGLCAAEFIKTSKNISFEIEWGDSTVVENGNFKISCVTDGDLLRVIARSFAESDLYGSTVLEKTEVDHWITLSLGSLVSNVEFLSGLDILNKALIPVTYLVGKHLTIADLTVFAVLYSSKQWQECLRKKKAPVYVLRWFSFIQNLDILRNTLNGLPSDVKFNIPKLEGNKESLNVRKKEGKFIALPGAEKGCVVRFPPEASGYLHIGHAKAALLNQYYQDCFQGKLILRFDDTNPAKENLHFEKVILEDLEMLEIKPDLFTHTSQYFDLMIEYCEQLLKDGKAYVDDTDPETMKTQRDQKIESPNRNNSHEMNMKLWNEMKNGTEKGQTCCVRAKIDMQSLNGCMRDPTIYRCKNELHPRTGDKYKVYPTYDFACPIVDAIEGVTHTLRTMEYHDRDPQFYWFIDALSLRKPYIWEYSRLSMTNTVLSKRKLAWFVSEGLVTGWDDPRMPTVRGVLRRGMTVQGLKEFIIAQGSSRSVVFMEWDKIWAFNKKIIDPIAPRYTALEFTSPVVVIVNNAKEECLTIPKHPKNVDIGMKSVWTSSKILIDKTDAECLIENENATFINWGNLLIKKILRENHQINLIEADLNLDNKDYKNTPKLTWLAVSENAELTPTWCVYFDHLISKPILGKDEDFKQYVGHETRKEIQMLGDPELKKLKKGDIIQLQRRGFFRVDIAYGPFSLYTCKEQSIILFHIPDGHTKENPIIANSKQVTNNLNDAKQETNNTIQSKCDETVNAEIIKQGDIVRNLKLQKAPKNKIDEAVKVLLNLKADYKKITNSEWKPIAITKNVTENDIVLNEKISKQGAKVRQLKSEKIDKSQIEQEVKILLALKSEYKEKFGKDWMPEKTIKQDNNKSVDVKQVEVNMDENNLLNQIAVQGEKIRDLKMKKSAKELIDAEVKILLKFKADYKNLSGKDWKPDVVVKQKSKSETFSSICNDQSKNSLNQIAEQGDKVRKLKAEKSDKTKIDEEVKLLLKLKTDFKNSTGTEWTPDMQPQLSQCETIFEPSVCHSDANDLYYKVTQQCNKVRDLKLKKATKEEFYDAVKVLLYLKAEYRNATGIDYQSPPLPPPLPTKPISSTKELNKNKQIKSKLSQIVKEKKSEDENVIKKQTRLGLEAKKEENLSEWYTQVITKGELIEYYDVSGCYILRPWSYTIWEVIKNWFDEQIKLYDVQNCYFPIFVSKNVLEKEKTHIADFSPEVAWVTKSGDSDLFEPIAIRPTSETVMYPAYAKWIQSYRDLPLKLNQWNNVVRWEFKHPLPFLRTREFLWQEGHTAYANENDAFDEVKLILDLYSQIYTDLLAVPVIKGSKTEKEKFAGGNYTYTIEAYISSSGRAIQGATSHHLGQNFSKMFDIIYEDPETKEKKYVYQNSWGITTRTIGVMIMVHADNQGLVLPPNVASIQIIIVPCGISAQLNENALDLLEKSCDSLEIDLKQNGIKVKRDSRSNYSPGWKFNHWELKGVPIRVELGPKDIAKNQIVAVRRDTGEKIIIPREQAVTKLNELLKDIQKSLLKKATDDMNNHIVLIKDWSQFTNNLDKKNMILSPFCGKIQCEDQIKNDSVRDDSETAEPGAPSMGAKSLCIPFDQPADLDENDKCIHPSCRNKPNFYTLFGRSY